MSDIVWILPQGHRSVAASFRFCVQNSGPVQSDNGLAETTLKKDERLSWPIGWRTGVPRLTLNNVDATKAPCIRLYVVRRRADLTITTVRGQMFTYLLGAAL